jgi:hypothetical protein
VSERIRVDTDSLHTYLCFIYLNTFRSETLIVVCSDYTEEKKLKNLLNLKSRFLAQKSPCFGESSDLAVQRCTEQHGTVAVRTVTETVRTV